MPTIRIRAMRNLGLAASLALLAAPAAAHALAISPLPGTPDASPQTQISIWGAKPSSIGAVSVRGSATGAHSGHLMPYSSGDGASFVLDKALAQGEHVSALATVAGHRHSWSFAVARNGAVSPPPIPRTAPTFDLSVLDMFHSTPSFFLPPKITINKTTPGVAGDGDLLLTPAPAPPIAPNQKPNPKAVSKIIGPGGPMIVDGQGNLVWFHLIQQTPGTAPVVSTNLRELTFAGQPALAWWQGNINPLGFGENGEEMIVDRNYKTLATIKGGNGYSIDLHEFLMTPAGDALTTVYQPVVANLSRLHGSSHAVILDSIIQLIDVKTGLVKWEWHPDGHIDVGDSYNTPVPVGYDPWHLNSMQLLRGNRILASMRNTWAGYDIDIATGRILWTLNGKHSSFKMGRGARFAFQHDIEMLSPHTITLYDDAAGPPVVEQQSRGLELTVSTRHHTASVHHQFVRPGGKTLAGSQGNTQTLRNGNKFVGFGSVPFISEFSSSGALLFDASLPFGDDTYRAYRVPWVGTPDPATTPPSLAGTGSNGSYTLFASWNGATEVASWQVLAGPSAGSLGKVGAPVARAGFETALPVQTNQSLVAVQALNSAGQPLGTSAAIAP